MRLRLLAALAFGTAPLGVATQSAAAQASAAAPRYTKADVSFMQHMIEHHGQALQMAMLARDATSSKSIRLLAERIDVSQRDEIALMARWMRERGQYAPGDDGHLTAPEHAALHEAMKSMPGMATPAQLDSLAAARGRDFDRRFLTLMIRHHEGALTMVQQLMASPGAAQETEIFRFASDVEADQRAEIARMRALLASTAPARR